MNTRNKKIDESGVKRAMLIHLAGIDQHLMTQAGVYITNNRLKELAMTRFLKKLPGMKKKRVSLKISASKGIISELFNSLKIVRMWKAFDEFDNIKADARTAKAEVRFLDRRMTDLRFDIQQDKESTPVEPSDPNASKLGDGSNNISEFVEPQDEVDEGLHRQLEEYRKNFEPDYTPPFSGIRESSLTQQGYENLVDPVGKT